MSVKIQTLMGQLHISSTLAVIPMTEEQLKNAIAVREMMNNTLGYNTYTILDHYKHLLKQLFIYKTLKNKNGN